MAKSLTMKQWMRDVTILNFEQKMLRGVLWGKLKRIKNKNCLMKTNAILEILQSCHKDHKTNQHLYCLLSSWIMMSYSLAIWTSIETKKLPMAPIKRNKLQSFKKNNSNKNIWLFSLNYKDNTIPGRDKTSLSSPGWPNIMRTIFSHFLG